MAASPAMGIPRTQLDRAAGQETAAEVIRQLLSELGNQRALEEFSRRGAASHLERDLGLGSLERVELMLRLDSAFGVRLPEKLMAEVDTVGGLLEALRGHPAASGPDAQTPIPLRYGERHENSPAALADIAQELARAETLTDVLRLRGRAHPAQPHIYLLDEDGRPRTITCGGLLERATAVAAELARRGIRPGQAVAIMLPTCAEFFWVFAGILIAGAIPVPIYPPYRADRIEEYAARQAGILRSAEARLMITFERAERVARLLRPQVPSLESVVTAARLAEPSSPPAPPETENRIAEALSRRARSDEIAFLQYTSGSTGNPKGVVLTHANLLANIRSIAKAVRVRPDDVVTSWLPLYHDMGLIGAWFVPLCTGIPLVLLSPLAFLYRPERWLWAIHRHRGTLSPAPNFAYELCVRKIADRDIEGLDLSSWRAALNGAEPVRPETLERFAARFAPYGFRREALLPVYGLAEASLGIATPAFGSGFHVDRIERAAFEGRGRAVPAAPSGARALEFVSVGAPLPGVEVRIVDSQGRDAGERVEGRLWFRGHSTTSGYYRNPEATRELVREAGWLDSGDLAYQAEGQLYITGRAKDVIIKGGRNLYPQEIEEIAGSVAGVRAGCVVAFGVPDAASGTERLVVAAEARDMAERDRIAAEITREVSDALGLPPDVAEIVPPHSIPKTSSGKLRRSDARRLYLEGRLGRQPPPTWFQVARLATRGAAPRSWAVAKRGLRRAAEIAWGLYALALLALFGLLLWLLLLPMPSRSLAARLTRRTGRLLLALAGVRVAVEGGAWLGEWEKSAPWIFAPNHSSYLDILVLLAFLPAEAKFIAKGEVRSMPLIRTFVRRIGHFAFDRSDPRARVEQAGEIERALERGESVVIYPEGTFTAARGIRPFQLGAFKAAVDTGRPVCPAAVRGAREMLRDETYLPRPGRITLTLGPLVLPRPGSANDWREIVRLRDAAREIIARGAAEPLL